MSHIPVFTTENIAGKKISQHLGLVRGNVIRSRHLGKDVLAIIRMVVGGEISEYTKLMAESREQALDRMVDEARRIGADAIVGVQFSTSMLARGAAELLVFGTAVKFEQEN